MNSMKYSHRVSEALLGVDIGSNMGLNSLFLKEERK